MKGTIGQVLPARVIAALLLGGMPLLHPLQPAHAASAAAPLTAHTGLHTAAGGHSDAAYMHEIQALSATIAGHIGQPLGLRQGIAINSSEVEILNAPALMYTDVKDAQGGHAGKAASCTIYINPSGDALQGRDWSVTLAHEVWHCFQGAILGLPRFARLTPATHTGWIIEGQADWVGEVVAGPDPSEDQGWWMDYLSSPQTPLFARTYDAIGFYSHVAERCGGPAYVWSILAGMLDKVPDNRASYAVATAGCDARFLDTWASGFFLDPERGSAWNTIGPGMPTGDTAAAALQGHMKVLSNGQELLLSADPYTNGIYELSSQADVVRVGLRGHARLSDAGNFDTVLAGDMTFCTRTGGCKCPTGSSYQGPPLTLLAPPADLALTGGSEANGTRLRLAGLTLSDFCGKSPVPPTSRAGGSLPDPCTLVTLSDVMDIVGRNPDFIYRTIGPVGNPQVAPGCEHIVVGTGVTGAVFIAVERRVGKAFSGPGAAVSGYGDGARLQAEGDFSRLLVAKGRLWIVIQVTMGTRSTHIALAVARTALSRL